jgi:hypothetical protein
MPLLADIKTLKILNCEVGMVVHIYYLSTWEVEAGGS